MSRTIMTAAELAALPDGRYFDGTYEWDKEGDDWTPLRAPSGMPTQPTSVEARVTTVREPLYDPSAPAPAPSVAAESAVEDRTALLARMDPDEWMTEDGDWLIEPESEEFFRDARALHALASHVPALTAAPAPSMVPEAAPREATDAALAFVSDVQKVINDDAGDDPDPSWVYDRLVGSLAVIDTLTASLHAPAPAPSATREDVIRVVAKADGQILDGYTTHTAEMQYGDLATALLARFNITPKEDR